MGRGSSDSDRRTFRDRQGELAQVLERHADASWLVVQGRAVDLHSIGVAVPQ